MKLAEPLAPGASTKLIVCVARCLPFWSLPACVMSCPLHADAIADAPFAAVASLLASVVVQVSICARPLPIAAHKPDFLYSYAILFRLHLAMLCGETEAWKRVRAC